MHTDAPATPAVPNTADILLGAMHTLTNAVAALVGSMTGFVPQIQIPVDASTEVKKSNEALIDTLEEQAKVVKKGKTKLDIDSPEKFDGTPENAVPFTQACEFYFGAKGESDIQQMITFALSKIKGGTNGMGTAWANQQRALIIQDPKTYLTWDAFTTVLHEHFQLQNDSAEAIYHIRTLEMGSGSAEDYTTTFKTYQVRSGYNEIALIEEYRRGLNKTLEERCRMTYPKPAKLSDWITRAVDLDKEYRVSRTKPKTATATTHQAKPRFEPRSTVPKASAPANNTYVRRDPNAMDVDATREEAKAKGLCYKCKKPGHRFFECPEKKSYTTRKVDVRAMSQEERAELMEQLQGFAEGQE